GGARAVPDEVLHAPPARRAALLREAVGAPGHAARLVQPARGPARRRVRRSARDRVHRRLPRPPRRVPRPPRGGAVRGGGGRAAAARDPAPAGAARTRARFEVAGVRPDRWEWDAQAGPPRLRAALAGAGSARMGAPEG